MSFVAAPANPPALEECSFYHSIELPGLGLQQGRWDLRGGYDAYLGGHDFRGERVLDVGTANGACSETDMQVRHFTLVLRRPAVAAEIAVR